MKTMRRRSKLLFLLYFCVTIPGIFGESHPLAVIYENTGRIPNENPSIREERQITFRNTFQDIPESLQKSVFTNRSNETFPGPKYYVILSDVQSSTLSNLLDVLSNDGRIYFPPRVNVLDRIDDPNLNEISTPININEFHSTNGRGRSLNAQRSDFSHEGELEDPSLFEITPPTNEFQDTKLKGRSIDSQLPNFSPQLKKVGKSLLPTKFLNDPVISDISDELTPPTDENFNFFQKLEESDKQTGGKSPNFNFQTRKAKIDNSVKKRASFNDDLSFGQFHYKPAGENGIALRPGKNLSKREETSEISVQGELGLLPANYLFNHSRPDFLSFIKRRSKNFVIKNEERIGLVDNNNILPEKPRPTIGKLVDMWKKVNNRYRKRLVTPPSSLVPRRSPKKSLRSSSLPPKRELEYSSYDEARNQNQNDITEIKPRKSLQIQAQEASQRQEKRLKSITEFSTEPNDFIMESLNEEEQFTNDEIRGRENSNFNFEDSFYDEPRIPQTSFSCSHQPSDGYYADVEVQCQVFHVCWGRRKASFLCPTGTSFSQKLQVCVWRQHVQCNYR